MKIVKNQKKSKIEDLKQEKLQRQLAERHCERNEKDNKTGLTMYLPDNVMRAQMQKTGIGPASPHARSRRPTGSSWRSWAHTRLTQSCPLLYLQPSIERMMKPFNKNITNLEDKQLS